MSRLVNITEASVLTGPRDKEGKVWDVVLIKEGFNRSGARYYTESALKSIESLASAEKIHCFADHMDATEANLKPEGSVLKVVGWYTDVSFDVSERQVVGKLNLLTEGSPFPHLPKAMMEAFNRGNPSLFELSIRGSAESKIAHVEGRKTQVIEQINYLASTDLVTRGGAGGAIRNVLESGRRYEDMDINDVLRDVSTEELEKALAESHPSLLAKPLQAAATVATTDKTEKEKKNVIDEVVKPDTAVAGAGMLLAQVQKERMLMEADRKLSSAKGLPKGVTARLRNQVEVGKLATQADLDAAITEEQGIYKELVESMAPKPTIPMREFTAKGDKGENVQLDSWDGLQKATQGLIAGKPVGGVTPFISLKEAFWHYKAAKGQSPTIRSLFSGGLPMAIDILRESRAGGYDPFMQANINEAMFGDYNIAESITSTTFATLLGVSMHKVFLDQYRDLDVLHGDYKKIISNNLIVTDFKTHNISRRGTYNSLPAVAAGGTYQAVTSPGEENVTVAVTKFGGVEDLTIEAIADDDMNTLRSIPRNLSNAAVVGRYRAVFDLFTADSGNGVLTDYDTVRLFVAAHNNRGTVALSSDELIVAANGMAQQSALNSTESLLFIQPRYMLVPNELRRLSTQLYTSDVEVDAGFGVAPDLTPDAIIGRNPNQPNPVKGMAEPIIVHYWTDATNWYLVADPARWPTVVFAVLQGHEEPMTLIQDDPTVGSVFSADKITIKVRDIRNQDVLDHRSFYGEIVA